MTGIYATLTHAQPFWADLHAVLAGALGGAGGAGADKIAPVDPETARAACALVLVALFGSRAARQFGVGQRGEFGLRAALCCVLMLGLGVTEKIKTN